MNVFKEAAKAETRLRKLDKREAEALKGVAEGYANRRAALIDGLDVQVRAALRGAGVLEREQTEPDDEPSVADSLEAE